MKECETTKPPDKNTTTIVLTNREMLEMARITAEKIRQAKKENNSEEVLKLTLRLAKFEVPLMDRWLKKGGTIEEWFKLISWHKDENIEQIIAVIDE